LPRFTLLSRRHLLQMGAALPAFMLIPKTQMANASMVLSMELPELTAQSDAIVVAEVTSAVSSFEEGHRAIRTEVLLRVQESWKGRFLGKTRVVRVVQPGGVVGDLEMKVHGLPNFQLGEKAVLFLTAMDKAHADYGFILTGLGQGKRRLFTDALGQLIAAPSDRSAAVRKTPTGSFTAAEQDPPLRLSDLRQQVRLLLDGQRR
jgi:hypothetical protein